MQLIRTLLRSAPSVADRSFLADASLPLQALLSQDPWRIAIASMLLNRTRRQQAEPALRNVLRSWPTAGDLARADMLALEAWIRPCGFAHVRSRRLQRFSSLYVSDAWEILEDLPGVGLYVADAVRLFSFKCVDIQSQDKALQKWKARLLCTDAAYVDARPPLVNHG